MPFAVRGMRSQPKVHHTSFEESDRIATRPTQPKSPSTPLSSIPLSSIPLKLAILWSLFLCGIGALGGAPLNAQPTLPVAPAVGSPSTSAQATPAEDNPDQVRVSPLDTVYLQRADGQLVPFFNIPFEVFEKLYEIHVGGQTDELPQVHTIEQLDVNGLIQQTPRGDLASLKIRLRVSPHRSGWVRVPLNLKPATLTGWDAGEQRDNVLVSVDSSGNYEAWVRGTEAGAVEFTLEAVVAVTKQGPQSILELAFPAATLAQLTLDLPLAEPEVTLSSERLIPQLEAIPGGQTRLTVAGPLGDATIRWRPRIDDPTSGLSVVTDVTVQIDGPDLIRYQAALDVVSLNGRDRSFLVQLPPGARFDAAEQLELEVNELEPGAPELEGLDPASRYLSIAFPQALDKPTRVVLFASRSGVTMDDESVSQSIEIGGFEVPRAVRQSGSILLVGSRDWRIDWTPGTFLRQVSLQAADREREGAVARFQFSRAPIDLQSRIVRNESRSACEPVLDIAFTRDRIQIDAELRYSFSGPRPETLIIDGRGWQPDMEQLRANRFVRRVSADETTPELWRIDLDPGLSDETLILRFVLTKPMESFGDLQIALPSPIASTVSAAMVALRSSDELEVTPRISPVQGTLVPAPTLLPTASPPGSPAVNPSSTTPPTPLPASVAMEGSAPVQWVRIQSLADVATLGCRVTVRPRKIDVASTVSLRIDGARAVVEQMLDYNVRYVPLTGGWLAIDRKVLDQGDLELRLDGQTIGFRPLASPLSVLDPRWSVIQFELPRGLTGTFQLEAQFGFDLTEPSRSDQPSAADLPLLVPLQAPDERTRFWREGLLGAAEWLAVQPIGDLAKEVVIDLPADRLVISADERWRVEESSERSDRRRFVLTKLDRDAVRSVPFTWTVGQGSGVQAPRVLRAWVQSLSTPEFRRDRVALRVATGRPTIELDLPAFVRLTTVAVDGVERVGASEQVIGQRLTLPLSPSSSNGEHTIELWYRFPQSRSFDRSLDLALPDVEGVDWIEQVYWETILPPDEYMMVQPQWLVSENRIEWKWWGWTESPRLSTGDLEVWVGVSAQQPPSNLYHRHLYSGFGEQISGRVWTARRWEVLFVGGGLLFLIGVTAVLLRLDRRPIAMLLIASLAFTGAAAVQPAGQWLAQLAILVSGFVAVGAYLSWLVARPSRRWVTRPATSLERSSPRSREPVSGRSSKERRVPMEEMATTQATGEVRS